MERENQILTSTGELGLQERTYGRLYWNWRRGIIADVKLLERAFQRLVFQRERMGKTRCVLRAPVSGRFIEEIYWSPLKDYIEVAMPIPEEVYSHRTLLLFLAKNQASRQGYIALRRL